MATVNLELTSTSSVGPERAAPLRHLDYGLIGSTLAIAALGAVMVYSATKSGLEQEGEDPLTYLKRQGLFLLVGMIVMAVAAIIDYRRLRELAPVLYLAGTLLLVLVLSPIGTMVNGSRSWFSLGPFQAQPAEFGKLAMIVALAAYCAAHRGDLDGRRLMVCLSLAGALIGLIFLQPDVGSILVYVAVGMGILLVAGARPRHIIALAVLGIIGVVVVFNFTSLVEDYQRARLTVFTSDGGDAAESQGPAFQLDQSRTAIAAGGLTGAGLFNGTQTKLGYVPEQQTDFIFTVVGEELGFAGSATLLALYALLGWRIWRTAQISRDFFGTLICVGVLSMLVFQVFENMGMTMGIMPITGIPLPLMSHGGSSLITFFAAIGLVLNVHMRRFA